MIIMRIVIIEDNKSLAEGIALQLQDQGDSVDILYDGEAGDQHLKQEGADLVILDINVGRLNGLELLKAMRRRNDLTPVILLTARGNVEDRIEGLDAGADDYLVKPFSINELKARMRALIRRKHKSEPFLEAISSQLTYDRNSKLLYHQEKIIKLNRRETAVLECFLARKNQIITKKILTDHLYGIGSDREENVIEIYISRLRQHLKAYGLTIEVERGLGYRMVEFKGKAE